MPLILPNWCPVNWNHPVVGGPVGPLYILDTSGHSTLVDPQIMPDPPAPCVLPCVLTYFVLMNSPFFSGLIEQTIYAGQTGPGSVPAYSGTDSYVDLLGRPLIDISYSIDGTLTAEGPFDSWWTGPPDPATPWRGTGANNFEEIGLFIYGDYPNTLYVSDGVNVTLNVTGGPSPPVQVLGPFDIGGGQKIGTLMVPIATNLTHPTPAGSVSIMPDHIGDNPVYSAFFPLPSAIWPS